MSLAPEQITLASPRATRAVLERFDLTLKHRFGQHFLINGHVLERILALGEVEADDVILEVGPGIGTLTQALLSAGARVIAIEQDETLLPALAWTCEPWTDSLRVIAGDALKVTAVEVNEAAAALGAGAPVKLVANLPYNAAATIVLSAFDRFESLQSATVMVQREVSERMMARTGTKSYGAYTVKLALRASTGASFAVPPSAFMPPPHVDSTVLRLNRRTPPLTPELLEAATLMADAAFAARRKTIANSMRGYFASRGAFGAKVVDGLGGLFSKADVAPTVRGETLPPEVYERLAAALLSL